MHCAIFIRMKHTDTYRYGVFLLLLFCCCCCYICLFHVSLPPTIMSATFIYLSCFFVFLYGVHSSTCIYVFLENRIHTHSPVQIFILYFLYIYFEKSLTVTSIHIHCCASVRFVYLNTHTVYDTHYTYWFLNDFSLGI